MSEHISVKQDGAVMRLGFNRPEKRNAITAEMYGALADGMTRAEQDPATRVVLFESTGDIFTAGNDIADFMAGNSSPSDSHDLPPVVRFLHALATAEKPLVAAVQGGAVGVGVTMLFHCDLVFAAESATFHMPFVDLGLVPEAASSLLIPAHIGHQRAAELLISGKKISAARAYELGFVNKCVPGGELAALAESEATIIAEKAPMAVRLTKKLMKGDRTPVLERMKEEGVHFSSQLQSAEFREAGMAFMQKRKPDFSKLG